MQQADGLDQDVHALKQRIDAAWRQLADPSLTRFARRELRNQMKQNDAELRLCMKQIFEREQRRGSEEDVARFPKPDLRILRLFDVGPPSRDFFDANGPEGAPDREGLMG